MCFERIDNSMLTSVPLQLRSLGAATEINMGGNYMDCTYMKSKFASVTCTSQKSLPSDIE